MSDKNEEVKPGLTFGELGRLVHNTHRQVIMELEGIETPTWGELDESGRDVVMSLIKIALISSSAEEFHTIWTTAMIEAGWSFGKFDPDNKISPDICAWSDSTVSNRIVMGSLLAIIHTAVYETARG